LADFSAADLVDLPSLPATSLEAWILGEFDRVAAETIRGYEQYDFKTVHKTIFDFCNTTLSSEYLAAVKDRLYCDAPASPRRRATQSALWSMTDGLCRLLAPIMAHTADEAYRALWKASDADRSVHLEPFIRGFGVTSSGQWPKALAARDAARLALERAKAELGVENPLDAGITLPDPERSLGQFDPIDLADLLIELIGQRSIAGDRMLIQRGPQIYKSMFMLEIVGQAHGPIAHGDLDVLVQGRRLDQGSERTRSKLGCAGKDDFHRTILGGGAQHL
jgi:hypothetical protein